jgi:hypothetical protein|tara:strand:+ start:178 stop:1149 length:972 start_codon:yes stop_codon:yes gene_type:complete
MKIFEFDSPDAMRDGAVARQVDGDGNPVNEDNTPIVTADSLFGNDNVSEEEAERNARLARENAEMLAEEEEKMVEQNHGLKFAIRPIKQFSIGRVEFPKDIIEEINSHIDDVIIPANESYANGLVGQLKNNEKSAQLEFPLDTEVGAQLKTVFEQIGKTYLKQGYNRDADTDCFQCWTNHAYAGDYNPYHDHGVQTPAGLSGFLWLKNPECIEDLDANIAPMSNASGSVDGFTHLIWGNNTRKDMMSLHDASEEYVKPEVGVMLVFPNWLKHQVMPFFGEGERRSIAMNWNVTDTEQQLRLFMSEREEKQYDEYLETKKANDE